MTGWLPAHQVELNVLDQPPSLVGGLAVVLEAPGVGRVEFGEPLAGELETIPGPQRDRAVCLAVQEPGGAVTSGVSVTGRVGMLCSRPGQPHDQILDPSYVVWGDVPKQATSVVFQAGRHRVWQEPNHQTSAFAWPVGSSSSCELIAYDDDGNELAALQV